MLFNFLKGIFSALSEIFSFFKQRDLIQAGADKVTAKQMKEERDVVIKAEEARMAAKSAAASTPSGSLPDDGFRRD